MGIEEKKQQRQIDEYLAGDGQATLRSATGNDAVTSSFAPVGDMTVPQLKIALGNVKKVVAAVATVCEDADYKAEIAKLSAFAFTAVSELRRKDPAIGAYVNIMISGTTMNIEVCGKYDATGGSTGNVLKLIRSKY